MGHHTLRKGSTLIMGTSDGGTHLHILLNNPGKHTDDRILLVNITSCRPGRQHDDACLLQPGDHPFVRHPSHISYQHAVTVKMRDLVQGVTSNKFTPKEPVTRDLLARICTGLCASRYSAPHIMDFYKKSQRRP